MSRRKTTRALLLAVTLSARAVAQPAPGEPPEGETSEPDATTGDVLEARQAFRLGSLLARQGQWVDALAAFERSARLRPHPITTYNMAYCERALGRYARATVRFAEALEPSGSRGLHASLPEDLAREAALYLEEVRVRVVHVRVTLSPAELTLRVGGRPLQLVRTRGDVPVFIVGERAGATLPSSFVETFELWLDPGAHVFVATGPGEGRVVESRTFTAGERAELRLTVAPPPPEVVPQTAKVRTNGEIAEAETAGSPDRLPAYVAFGVGGAALAGGAVFAGLALAEKRSLDAEPACVRRQCPPSYAAQQERMRRFADFATAGLVTGLVGLGVGTYLLVTSGSPAPETQKARRVAPWVTGNTAGLTGRF